MDLLFSYMVQIFNDFDTQKIENVVFYIDSNMKMCKNFPTFTQVKTLIIL